MATGYINTGSVVINDVILTARVKSYSVDLRKDQIDDTALNDTAHSYMAGLQNNEVTFEFQQDFIAAATNATDATLYAIWNAGVAVTILVRVTSAAISATNPEYQLSGVLFDYSPVSGAVGDESLTTATFMCTTIATRATSA